MRIQMLVADKANSYCPIDNRWHLPIRYWDEVLPNSYFYNLPVFSSIKICCFTIIFIYLIYFIRIATYRIYIMYTWPNRALHRRRFSLQRATGESPSLRVRVRLIFAHLLSCCKSEMFADKKKKTLFSYFLYLSLQTTDLFSRSITFHQAFLLGFFYVFLYFCQYSWLQELHERSPYT